MKFSISSLRAAAMSLVVLAAPAIFTDAFVPAAAEAGTSVNFNLFYDGLSAHGRWVNHGGNHVFVPRNRPRGWRPYTVGRWDYASSVGWTWRSQEPFGWATYHYGRWGRSADLGWYWVPGRRWAPAWVSWRSDRDNVVWAPLPADGYDGDVSIRVSAGRVPDDYWVAVPSRGFLDGNLSLRIVSNDNDRLRIVRRARPRGAVVIRNNVVVNTVINIRDVERDTGRKAIRANIRKSDDPQRVLHQGGGDDVLVFGGNIDKDPAVRPKKISSVEDVKKERNSARNEPTTQTEPDAGKDVAKAVNGEESKAKRKADGQGADQAGNGEETKAERKARRKAEREAKRNADGQGAGQAGNGEETKAERKARRKAEREAKRNADGQGAGQAGNGEETKAERKARRKAEREAKRNADGQGAGQAGNGEETKAERKARRKAEREAKRNADGNGQGVAQDGSGGDAKAERKAKRKAERQKKLKAERQAKRKAKKGKKNACDPAVDANCAQ